MTLKGIWNAGLRAISLKDRVAPAENATRHYAVNGWATREPKVQHDIDAPKVNASVFIATRAISDAIRGLPVHICQVEHVEGVTREVEDSEHPANSIIQRPNSEHTWSELMAHMVKAYLSDGNGLCTIERNTGPNLALELWPRNTKGVEIDIKTRSYKFGSHTAQETVYPRERVLHVRDIDPTDPFWGIGRINTVRDEIMMDYFITRFNSKFFVNGACLNLMFTPDNNLTEDQHTELLDAITSETGGVDNSFKTFINRFAGKWEYPEQKHKDIAFGELLKNNREKIFGVFGLPPFRGGVMEYANYANALAQDADFWNNTIRPILQVFETAINAQVLWPIYGTDIRLKFDLDDIPAIRGDVTAQEDRLLKLFEAGLVSDAYVREQLDIPEDAAPVKQPMPAGLPPADGVPAGDATPAPAPTKQEKQQVAQALYSVFKEQRKTVVAHLNKTTANGMCMEAVFDVEGLADRFFPITINGNALRTALLPVFAEIIRNRSLRNGSISYANNDPAVAQILVVMKHYLEHTLNESRMRVASTLYNIHDYNWTYNRASGDLRNHFTLFRAEKTANILLGFLIPSTIAVIGKTKHADVIGGVVITSTNS